MNLTRTFQRFGIFLGTLSLAACVGAAPGGEDPVDGADAGAEEADAAVDPGPTPLEVSGKIIDYFANNITPGAIVANATLTTDGLSPAVEGVADALGAYTMDILPASLFYVNVTALDFVPSKNAATQVLDAALIQDQYAASTEGVARQYTGAGGGVPILPIAGNGIIMVELQRNNGDPAIDVPVADIVLASVAAPEIPVGTAYLVDPLTTDLSPIDVTLVSAVDANNTARAGFLNVPPGDYTISVTIPAGGGGGGGGGDGGIQTVSATVLADGATFVNPASEAGGGGGGGGRGGQAAIVLDPNSPLGFTEDIYPVLMTVAEGGDGCVSCHNEAHILPFTGTPEETLALLNLEAVDPLGTLRIDLVNPELSAFLTNPVYEAIPNHPNAFWTVNSNHYQGIMAWIVQGAALLRADAVLPPPPA
jgi:hypothetical protein